MIHPHSHLTANIPHEGGLWRYMDLPRLLSMFHFGQLWFARADLLGDAHEGSVGAANLVERAAFIDSLPVPARASMATHLEWTRVEVRTHVFVSCWYMSDVESVAMWHQYGSNGIAIRTSFDLLSAALPSDPQIFGNVISYSDFDTTLIDEQNVFSRFMNKRLEYMHEREARLITFGDPPDIFDPPEGLAIPFNANSAVTEIRVAPGQPEWVRSSIESALRATGSTVPVLSSRLDTPPAF